MSSGNNSPIAEDRAPTVTETGSRLWLYPDRRSGPIERVRKKLALLLVLFYLAAPWIRVNGAPLLRLDVLAKKASFFGAMFSVSEASYLVFIFLLAAALLVLVTTLFGRLWCGYACPQTVFVEWIIRPIEEFIEGSAHHRRVADSRKPWSTGLWLRKLTKHAVYFVFACVVANTFIAYFTPPEMLLGWMVSSPAEHPIAFLSMCIIFGVFYFDLVYFREQFCSFLCPYARFQSIIMDNHSPTIAYVETRGEPRGRGDGKGDCIDCKLCVRVCPTGIDIRRGLQLECIMCGRCADACDQVMSNLGRSAGLITKASVFDLAGQKKTWLRPRVVLYTIVCCLLAGVIYFKFSLREQLQLVLTRAPGSAYSVFADGKTANMFLLRVVNNSPSSKIIKLVDVSPPHVTIICGACAGELQAGSEVNLSLVIVIPDEQLSAPTVSFRVEGAPDILTAPLIIPAKR